MRAARSIRRAAAIRGARAAQAVVERSVLRNLQYDLVFLVQTRKFLQSCTIH